MSLTEYKALLTHELRPRTVTFFTKEGEVLLGYKKSGFGKGNYLGIGGKVEGKDASIEEGACREISEEIGVNLKPNDLRHVGVLRFYFPHIADESWNQEVTVFLTDKKNVAAQETDEIRPKWVKKDNLPFNTMWDDAKYWLPRILKGEKITGEFLFDNKLHVIDHAIKEIPR